MTTKENDPAKRSLRTDQYEGSGHEPPAAQMVQPFIDFFYSLVSHPR